VKYTLIAPFLIFSTLSAFSQDLKIAIAKCASIENSVERLAAYDALAKSLGVAEPATTETKGFGKWEQRTAVSPIDDSKSYILSLDANERVNAGHKAITPTLIARYTKGDLELYITYNDLFIDTESTLVTCRIDKEDAFTMAWGVSTDHEAVFVPLEAQAKLMGMTIGKAKTLVVQLTPYSESPVTSSFDISGFSEFYNPLLLERAKELAK